MAIYEQKEWSGGISSFSDRGIRGSFKMGANLDIRKTVDTLTAGQALKEEGIWGYSHSSSPSLSPSASNSPSGSASGTQSPSATASQSNSSSGSPSASKSLSPSGSASPSGSTSASPSSAGSVYVDLVLFWVKATDGATYGFGNAGYIYRRYADGYVRNVWRDPDGGIRGAVEKPSSNGKTYLQWATANKLKQKELVGASDWSDVTTVAENLTGSDWHTMVQVGGANYIANGNFLALCGYDDSFTNEALDIIPVDQVKTLVERNGRAVIGTYKTGYPNKGTNAMIDCEYPLAQIGDDGYLYYADFTNTMPIKRFPAGGRVNPNGVTNEVDQVNIYDWESNSLSWVDKQTLGNMSLWGVFGATSGYNGVYTYGRRNKEQPFTLNLEYALEVDEIGAVATVEGTTIISYRSGGSYGVKAVDATTKAVGRYESLEFRSPMKGVEKPTNWKYAEIFTENLPAGTSIEMFYKMNKASSWTRAYTANGGTAMDSYNMKKGTFRIGAEGDVFEYKLLLNSTGNVSPTVLRVRVYFE